jgi:hypothetical protein
MLVPRLRSGRFRSNRRRATAAVAVGLVVWLLGVVYAEAQPRGEGQVWLEERVERFGPYGQLGTWDGSVFHLDGRFVPTNLGLWNYWLDVAERGQEFRLDARLIPTGAGRLSLQLGDYAFAPIDANVTLREFQPWIWARGATAALERNGLVYAIRAGQLTERRSIYGWGRTPSGAQVVGAGIQGRWGEEGTWQGSVDRQSGLTPAGAGLTSGQLLVGRQPPLAWNWFGLGRLSREDGSGNWGGSLMAGGGYTGPAYTVGGHIRRISPSFRSLGVYPDPHVNEWGVRLEGSHRLFPVGLVGASLDYAQDLARWPGGRAPERRYLARMYVSTALHGPFYLSADFGLRDRSTVDPDSLLVDQAAVNGGARLGWRGTNSQLEVSYNRMIFRDPTEEFGDWHESRAGFFGQQYVSSAFRADLQLWLVERRLPTGTFLSRERSAEARLTWLPKSNQTGWLSVGRQSQSADESRFEREQWQLSLGWQQPLPWDLSLQVETFHFLRAAGSIAPDRARWQFRITRRFSLGHGRPRFGEVLAETGTIRGYVFEDLNGNGLQEKDEPGISGIPLRLGSGGFAMTAGNGFYEFLDAATGMESITLDVARLPTRYLTPGEPRNTVSLRPGESTEISYPIRPGSGVVGRIVLSDGSRAEGVPDVLFVVKGTHHDVFTDAEGRFFIPGLEPGTVTLQVVEWSLPSGTRLLDPLERDVVLKAGEVSNSGVYVLEPGNRQVLQIYRPGSQRN